MTDFKLNIFLPVEKTMSNLQNLELAVNVSIKIELEENRKRREEFERGL